MVPRSSSPSARTSFAPPGPSCHFVPRFHCSYEVLRLPRSIGLGSGSPCLRPTASWPLLRVRHRSAATGYDDGGHTAPPGLVTGSLGTGSSIRGETRVSRVTGPPSCSAPWSITPPSVLLPCPYSSRSTVAFREGETLGTRYHPHFGAAFPWLGYSHAYASSAPLPWPTQGLLPDRRAQRFGTGLAPARRLTDFRGS